MAKRIYFEDNYLVIAEALDLTDDMRNLRSNVYVEKNGDLFIFYKLSTDVIVVSIRFTDILDVDGNAYADLATFTDLIEKKTGKPDSLDVNIQDQTTPLIALPLNKITDSTTLTAIAARGQYVLNVASITGVVAAVQGVSTGSYIRLFSFNSQRFYVGYVIAVNALALTMDRPLDSEFENGAPVDVAITNLNVDGSVVSQIFSLRSPSTPEDLTGAVDITRLMFGCTTTEKVDLSTFGDLPALARGIVIRKTDGLFYNILNAKSNGSLATNMYDWTPYDAQNLQQGQNGFLARFTLTNLGVVLRLKAGEDLEVVIQDDLRTLLRFEIIVEGHIVQD